MLFLERTKEFWDWLTARNLNHFHFLWIHFISISSYYMTMVVHFRFDECAPVEFQAQTSLSQATKNLLLACEMFLKGPAEYKNVINTCLVWQSSKYSPHQMLKKSRCIINTKWHHGGLIKSGVGDKVLEICQYPNARLIVKYLAEIVNPVYHWCMEEE